MPLLLILSEFNIMIPPPYCHRLGLLTLFGGLATSSIRSQAAASFVDLGTARSFGVLAGTAITVTGPTVVRGDAGTTSGTAITGAGSLTLLGINYGGGGLTPAAQTALTSAYLNAAGQPADFNYPLVADLGGLTLMPGVHRDPSSFAITGMLTLDGGGDSNALWIFQAFSTLTTGSNSSVILTNGAKPGNILWQVGSSATLGTGSQLQGNVLAFSSITLTTGAVVEGGVYARNGAVTFDRNSAGIPEPMTGMLTLAGLLGVAGRRKR